jgi:hypothetical protein
VNNYYNSYAKNSKKYVVCPKIDENQKRGAILGGKRRGQGNDPNGAKTTVTNDRIFGGAAPYTYKANTNLRNRRNCNRVFMSLCKVPMPGYEKKQEKSTYTRQSDREMLYCSIILTYMDKTNKVVELHSHWPEREATLVGYN